MRLSIEKEARQNKPKVQLDHHKIEYCEQVLLHITAIISCILYLQNRMQTDNQDLLFSQNFSKSAKV
jgi:hypothetical protein